MKTEEQKRQWAAYKAITAQRAREAGAKAKDDGRRALLIVEAKHWREAEDIRSYVQHVVSTGPAAPGVDAWSTWALQVAAEHDPTTTKRQLALATGAEAKGNPI